MAVCESQVRHMLKDDSDVFMSDTAKVDFIYTTLKSSNSMLDGLGDELWRGGVIDGEVTHTDEEDGAMNLPTPTELKSTILTTGGTPASASNSKSEPRVETTPKDHAESWGAPMHAHSRPSPDAKTIVEWVQQEKQHHHLSTENLQQHRNRPPSLLQKLSATARRKKIGWMSSRELIDLRMKHAGKTVCSLVILGCVCAIIQNELIFQVWQDPPTSIHEFLSPVNGFVLPFLISGDEARERGWQCTGRIFFSTCIKMDQVHHKWKRFIINGLPFKTAIHRIPEWRSALSILITKRHTTGRGPVFVGHRCPQVRQQHGDFCADSRHFQVLRNECSPHEARVS
jgi:hypothetical protein